MPGSETRRMSPLLAGLVAAAMVVVTLPARQPLPSGTEPGPAGAKRALMAQAARAAEVRSQPVVSQREIRSRGVAYARGRLVVQFDPDLRPRGMRAVAERVDALRIVRPSSADFHYVEIPADSDPVEAAARLAGEPGVMWAEPDPIVRPLWKPNDPYYIYQWNFDKIGMQEAWNILQGGSTSVTVAVLDTGVAYVSSGAFAQASDLAGTHFVAGYDFIWDDNVPLDTDGHGTHVTGTIAQTTNNNLGAAGMAFGVNVMPVKVLSSDWDESQPAPNSSTMSLLARGIRFAVDNGARVLNMSLGAEAPSSAVESAIQYAVGKGAFIAVAAGNGGDEKNAAEWPASYAAGIDGVMAVAAVGYDLTRAPYSTHRDYVEIAAPGGDLSKDLNKDGYKDGILQQTLDEDYLASGVFNRFTFYFFQGTSMAAPHVTALAALLMNQGITSPATIEATIKRTASNRPAGGRSNDLGYGIIDAQAALRGLGLAR